MNRQQAVVIGAGKLGCQIISDLSKSGANVTVLDMKKKAFERLNEFSGSTKVGDGYQSLRVFIANLRKDIEIHDHKYIHTKIGIGYHFLKTHICPLQFVIFFVKQRGASASSKSRTSPLFALANIKTAEAGVVYEKKADLAISHGNPFGALDGSRTHTGCPTSS